MLLHISQNIFFLLKKTTHGFWVRGEDEGRSSGALFTLNRINDFFLSFIKNHIIVSCICPNRMSCTRVNNYLEYYADSVQMRKMYWFIKIYRCMFSMI